MHRRRRLRLWTLTNADPPSHRADQIGDLLRDQNLGEEYSSGPRRPRRAAENWLSGQDQQHPRELLTQQALRDFERAHGLSLTTEITPRLVKQLTSAARGAEH